ISASKSSALSTISSARERPTKRGSHSSAPPPGTSPTPISGLPNTALCRLAKRMSQARTNSLPMPRVRPRILATLMTGVDERRSTKSRQRSSTPDRSAALDTSRWAIKKSGFADWNTTTFADGSASRSVISAPNSTIVVGANILIGGLLKVTVQRPGQVRSVLNCEGSGIADLLCACGTFSGRFAERSEARVKLFGKEHRLFPGGKMPASLEFVVIDEFRIRPFRPTPRGWIQLVRKHAHGNGDGDAFGIEIPEFAPI